MHNLTENQLNEVTKTLDLRLNQIQDDIRSLMLSDHSSETQKAGLSEDVSKPQSALNANQHNLMKRQIDEIKAISDAKDRISFGNYGICRCCGKTIAAEELLKSPSTALCKLCREQ